MAELILASASPRRLQLLEQVGIIPSKVIPADIDESCLKKELPKKYALRVARQKAEKIAETHKNKFIIAADTVVALGRRILPKAEDINCAKNCLNLLSGRRHRVIGGIYIISPNGKISSRIVDTVVAFKRLSKIEIKQYLNSKEWEGKAGGYAIQGLAATYIKFIRGSYSNVVGLSLYDTAQMLNGLGYKNNDL